MTPSVEVIARRMSEADALRLATLHIDSIDQGFLSSLGRPVVAKLYQAFATHRQSDLYVVRDAYGDVVGLAVTSGNVRSLYLHFLVHAGPTVIVPVARRLLSWRTIVAIAETLVYPFRRGQQGTRPAGNRQELLNLCVDESARGGGIGRALVSAAISTLATHGGGLLKIVTGGHQQAAHRLYEALGARRVGKLEVHRGGESYVYELTVLAATRG